MAACRPGFSSAYKFSLVLLGKAAMLHDPLRAASTYCVLFKDMYGFPYKAAGQLAPSAATRGKTGSVSSEGLAWQPL